MKKVTEAEIKCIIKECVLNILRNNRVLNEGMTADNPAYEKWCWLVDTYGADKILEQIFLWTDSSRLEEYIQWFEQEGWLDNEEYNQ